MLEEIRVRDLALIQDVRFELGSGMTVLTGETGAGKTALVGAIKLLIGERADSTLVRAGSDQAVVEGRFRIDDAEHVVRRTVSAEGRSRCTVDGDMVTVGELSGRFGPLFDLHGQHEHQALLDIASHVSYLDRYAGDPAHKALVSYGSAFDRYRAASRNLSTTEATMREAAEKAEYLQFVLEEIERIAPEPGEDEALRERMPGLVHGEKLTAAASEGHAALARDGGAADAMAMAAAALAKVADLDPRLDALALRLTGLTAELNESVLELREYAESLAYDPSLIDAAQRRLADLEGLQKKYGSTIEDVLATAQDARKSLEMVAHGDEELSAAREAVEKARVDLEAAGGTVIRIRDDAAQGFVEALSQEVAGLAMQHARFEVDAQELPLGEWGSDGPQHVEFLYAPGADQPARPLSRIASGGELSRVMLALKGVLGTADKVPVLVFDEVDAGIGGATALSIAERLADLSSTHQLLVVTHLAQVAAVASRHLIVEKDSTATGVSTDVIQVEGARRVGEIARMLSGSESDASKTHARELLERGAGDVF